MAPRINRGRLLGSLETFDRIGALPAAAIAGSRSATRTARARRARAVDARARLKVTIDAIGNIVGVRGGRDDLRDDLRDDFAPVMLGSHVDGRNRRCEPGLKRTVYVCG
jgi:beta-ureidopropionase / N-carbamoyl-L-amino-acid hydrolase